MAQKKSLTATLSLEEISAQDSHFITHTQNHSLSSHFYHFSPKGTIPLTLLLVLIEKYKTERRD